MPSRLRLQRIRPAPRSTPCWLRRPRPMPSECYAAWAPRPRTRGRHSSAASGSSLPRRLRPATRTPLPAPRSAGRTRWRRWCLTARPASDSSATLFSVAITAEACFHARQLREQRRQLHQRYRVPVLLGDDLERNSHCRRLLSVISARSLRPGVSVPARLRCRRPQKPTRSGAKGAGRTAVLPARPHRSCGLCERHGAAPISARPASPTASADTRSVSDSENSPASASSRN